MKTMFINEDDLFGDCQDWLNDAAAKKFIDGEYTHLEFDGDGDLVEAEIVPFEGVLIGEYADTSPIE